MTIYSITTSNQNVGSNSVLWKNIIDGAEPISLDIDHSLTPDVSGYSIFDESMLLVSASEQPSSVPGVPKASKVTLYNGTNTFTPTFSDAKGNTIYNAAVEGFWDLGSAGKLASISGTPQQNTTKWRTWYGLFDVTIADANVLFTAHQTNFPDTYYPNLPYVVYFNGNVYFLNQQDLYKVVVTGDKWVVQEQNMFTDVFKVDPEKYYLQTCTTITGQLQVFASELGVALPNGATLIATLSSDGEWSSSTFSDKTITGDMQKIDDTYYQQAGYNLLSSSDGNSWSTLPLPSDFTQEPYKNASASCLYYLTSKDIYLAVTFYGSMGASSQGLYKWHSVGNTWTGTSSGTYDTYRYSVCNDTLYAYTGANVFNINEDTLQHELIDNSPSGVYRLLNLKS